MLTINVRNIKSTYLPFQELFYVRNLNNVCTHLSFQELQYIRKEAEVRVHVEEVNKARVEKIELARKNNSFMVCQCCGDDECIDEDMLPW